MGDRSYLNWVVRRCDSHSDFFLFFLLFLLVYVITAIINIGLTQDLCDSGSFTRGFVEYRHYCFCRSSLGLRSEAHPVMLIWCDFRFTAGKAFRFFCLSSVMAGTAVCAV